MSSSCRFLPLRAALYILKTSHPGCNVNNAEGRPSRRAEAGRLSRRLIPGEHIQNVNMVILRVGNDPEVPWASLGDTAEPEAGTLSLLL